jgi:Ras-related protein Rab-6A
VQLLFRRIALALSRMETLLAKQEDMVDVNLKPTSNQSNS